MTRRTQAQTILPEIDASYENRQAYLQAMPDEPGAAMASSTAVEPLRQQRPATWTPAQTSQQQQQAERQQVASHLRQLIDQQGQEPPSTSSGTGNKFRITEATNAKDRAGAGLRWWAAMGLSALPLVFGVGLWLFWGWGFFAFCFSCFGGGILGIAIWLNWQAGNQSPISIEKKQRTLDHEYRMFREENAQRSREMIIVGFMGNARQDVNRNTPVVDGQILLVGSQNEVRQ